MRNFKEYLELICESDSISSKIKLDAKKRGLSHSSHNIWKDKQGQEFKWDDQGKKFEKVADENKMTPEQLKKVQSSIAETESLISKELSYSDDLRHNDKIAFWKKHLKKLRGMVR